MRCAFLLALMALGFVVLGGCKEDQRPQRIAKPQRGYLAPEIHGEDPSGEPFSLSDSKGKVILLDFHAEWCGPCRMFYPRGRALVKRYKNRPFVLLGVNLDDEPATAKAAFDSGEITWRSWWDGGTGAITRRWGVEGYPTFFLIDAKGIIRAQWVGLAGNELEEGVEKLVQEVESKSS